MEEDGQNTKENIKKGDEENEREKEAKGKQNE